jgi:phosphatidylserine decarboxylase
VSPIDGTLLAVTPVNIETTLEIKGLDYSVFDLLSPLFSEVTQSNLQGYSAWHFYLSPKDYHRVHSPCEGVIEAVGYIPGTLWPVTSWALRLIPKLYTKNERVVIQITRPSGAKIFVILVGALNVGNITLAIEPKLETNPRILVNNSSILNKNLQWMPQAKKFSYMPARKVVKGDEVGIFHLGSTVILLSPDNEFKPSASLVTTTELLKKPIQFGQSLLT